MRLRRAVGDASEVMSEAMVFADLGDMALRSMYVRNGARCARFVTEVDLHASMMRRALATASRGGTMLRMISACATRSSAVTTSVIWAALIRSNVSRLCKYQPQSAVPTGMLAFYLLKWLRPDTRALGGASQLLDPCRRRRQCL